MALEMKGEYALAVQQTELWRLLNDPDVLAKIIPGCNTVRLVGIDCYEMGLKLQVGSVSGEYMGSVAIFDKQEPLHYVLTVEGQGSIGFMKGSAAFDLEAQGEGESLLRYAGSAEVGGVVAGVGQRVLSGVAKFLAGRFFKALEKHIDENKKEAKGASEAKGPSDAKDPSEAKDASAA
jgi:carbon monoxide dehydrogenase subunit G